MLKRTSHWLGQVDASLQPVFQEAMNRFQLDEMSIHGPTHWLRVFRGATEIARQTSGADLLVCQLFAILHDCERQDDGSDIQHGPRAAVHAMEMHLLGKLPISRQQLDLLCQACRHHTDGHISSDPTIGACWDADRLDLPRVGVRIDARYLSTQAAKAMI